MRYISHAIVMVLIGFVFSAAQDHFYGWGMLRESGDGTVFLVLDEQKAVVSQTVTLEVTRNGQPKSLALKFPNGFERNGTDGELRYYWNERKGINAWWRHMHSRGKLEVRTPTAEAPAPGEWYGRVVACISTANRHYVGRLVTKQGSGQWFGLEIEGAVKPVPFYYGAIKELHGIK